MIADCRLQIVDCRWFDYAHHKFRDADYGLWNVTNIFTVWIYML